MGRAAACDSSSKTGPGGGEGDEEGARSAAVAKAIMAKLARGGVVGGDVEALQEQVGGGDYEVLVFSRSSAELAFGRVL